MVTVGSFLPAGMPEAGVSRRCGRVHSPAGSSFGRVRDVCAAQAGVLAMVMTAGAMRVTVPAGPACAKDEGDLDLRARCRSRSRVFLYCPISLVTAL